MFLAGELDCGRFAMPALRCGNVAVCLQPARGYNIDPASSYHDPDLPPPHGYLAFYAWLRDGVRAHAVVHFGKHGNLEWLPGKALALSAGCFPEAALGPLPHLYPFIVNDPGEGTQAKRRAQAVIIDHLTPPLTRAESYGPMRELERLVDEYADAAAVDPRRLGILSEEILSLMRITGLDIDCGIGRDDKADDALVKLDRYLCELKEMQIRDGLHVFGASPEGSQLRDLLVAIARTPRGPGERDASLIRALADDLRLGFDPLAADLGDAWTGPRPATLEGGNAWRTFGDTLERLEALAGALVGGERPCQPEWTRTRAVLDEIEQRLRPAVARSGESELRGLLSGFDGRFVAPGPSGAPTRGRPDVLPTGRNFYSIDTRIVPTPGRLDPRLEVGEPAGAAPRAGARRMAEAPRHHRLGNEQHAHRRRRHRAGAGADGRPPDLGKQLRTRSRLRNPAGLGAGSAARRRDVAHLRVFPRRFSQSHRPVRLGGARRSSPRRARGGKPARRAGAARRGSCWRLPVPARRRRGRWPAVVSSARSREPTAPACRR